MIHPCKVYSAMATGRPLLYVGPAPSHISDLLERYRVGWRVGHGEVGALVALVERIVAMAPAELEQMGQRGRAAVAASFTEEQLCGELCDAFELALRGP